MTHHRLAIVLLLLTNCASAPIRERCRITMECVPLPKAAQDFAEIDGLLVRRAAGLAASARDLQYFMGDFYKREFLEQLLPQLCDRVTAARALAAEGKRQEAGAHYQGLAVVAEVMALEVALAQVADYADHAGEPSAVSVRRLEEYDRDVAPLMAAALSNDRQRLASALREGAVKHVEWLGRLDAWERDLRLGAERVEIAHKLWDTSLAVVAMYEMAGVAAELVSPPRPPLALGAVAGSGSAVAIVDRAALAGAVEALRKLVVSGAMDAVVVAGLAELSGVQKPMAMAAPGLAPIATDAVKASRVAARPKRIYSANGLIRPANEPGPFHDFPESFDQQIFEKGKRTVTPNFWKVAKPGLSNDAVMYELRGSVNGTPGTFEIGVRPSVSGETEVIMHRFFRPDP